MPVVEQKYLRLDGEVLDVEVMSGRITYGGKPAIQAFMRDATERKRLERELRDSQERYQKLADNAPDPIVVYSDGLLIYVNEATLKFIAATTRAELIGMPILNFIHPEFHEEVNGRLKTMIETGLPAPLAEQKYIRLDGKVIFAEISAAPIMYEGKPAFQAILRDVTKRKEMEAALLEAKEVAESATKLKDKFVSLVSHDLKSPVLGIMELLKIIVSDERRPLDVAHKTRLNKVLNSSRGLLELINRLLDVNRLQTGKITPIKRKVNCRRMVEQRMEPLRRLAEMKGISVRNDLSPKMWLLADPDLLGECVTNLLTNAIKFCDHGSEAVVFNPAGRPTTLAVRDTGPGVEREFLPNLFSHEIKTCSLGTKGERGTGLGLPCCNDIMAAHHGSITVASTAGSGSTFYLTLPELRPAVLVVDDQEASRQMVREGLEGLQVEVLEAEDGYSALEIIKGLTPVVVLTDIVMPGMGGLTSFVN